MKFIEDEALKKRCADPSRVNIVVPLGRPGAVIYLTRLEYEHFAPDTPWNDLFDLFESKHQGVMCYTASIPAEALPIAQQVAEEEKLCLVNGTLGFLTGEGLTPFVVDSPNTYALESLPEHPCNSKGFDPHEALGEEIERCEVIHAAHYEKFMATKGKGK